MRKMIYITSMFIIFAFVLTGFGVQNSSVYKEVKIGTQVWMAENLNVDKFRNGDSIPEARTEEEWERAGESKQPAWCYFDNDPANGEKYGKLYNWFAVNDSRGLAPVGWHIPNNAEWDTLVSYLGGDSIAGGKMKSITGWYNSGCGTNESGFSARPGGSRCCDVEMIYPNCDPLDAPFKNIGVRTSCWSISTIWDEPPRSEDEAMGLFGTIYNRGLAADLNYIFASLTTPATGLSVRCVKD